MSKEVVTNIVMVSVNEVSDEDIDEILQDSEYDTLEEYAASLEETVESLLVNRFFADADEIPLVNVDTFVETDVDDYEKGVRR